MQRTEADIVKNSLSVIEEYKANPHLLKNLEIGERVASRMVLNELHALLKQYQSSGKIATPKSLKPLEDYLRKCKQLLIGTPILMCYQPALLANKACIALAEELATVLPYTALDLLLPGVIIPDNFKTRYYNNFVVTEDGYLIDVLQGLDTVREDKHHLYLHPATKKEMDPDLLGDHSTLAMIYAAKIRSLNRPSEEDIADCDKSREDLNLAINDNSVTRRAPAHKEAGKKRLMMAVTKKIHTPKALAEFMDANVPKNEWVEFLSSMERDELCRILIPKRGQTPQKQNQAASHYKGEQATQALPAMLELASSVLDWPATDMAKRALVFTMNYLYSQLRNDAPEYTDLLGGWGGMSFSKTQVLAQTKAMHDFLLGDENMVDLERYLKKQVEEKKMIAINSPTCLALKNKIIDAGRHCAQVSEPMAASVSTLAM